MASALYNQGKAITSDFDDITLVELILVDDTYVFDPDHLTATIILDELSGPGYSRKTIVGRTITVDNPGDTADHTATDPAVFSGINAGTIGAAVILDSTGVVPIAFLDSTDFPLVTNGGDVQVNFAAGGEVFAVA